MTQRTKTELLTQINTLLADNTAGDISASDIRSVLTDIRDSLAGGPSSATDNALVRFDSTTGQLIKNSTAILTDAGDLTVNSLAVSVGDALTSTGTTCADALVLTKAVNIVSTADSGTGVVLPAGVVGQIITIENAGANPIKVYGNGSDTIDGVAGDIGVTLTNAKRCLYICSATNTYISAQLGAISA